MLLPGFLASKPLTIEELELKIGINNLPKERAMHKLELELMTLRSLRVSYLIATKSLAGE